MIWEFILHNSPVLAIVIPLLSAFLMPLIGRYSKKAMYSWLVGALILTEIIVIILVYDVYTYGTQIYVMGANPYNLAVPPDSGGIPIRIILTVDAFSSFMAFIAATAALAGGIYSIACESMQTGQEKYYALLLLLLVGMLGMVLTGDLFNFFVFLEINSLSSAALVAYRVDKGVAVEAAFKYAIISSIGALLFLFAIGILYGEYDALNMAMLASRMKFTELDKIVLSFMGIVLAMKCGAFPMHMWVPDAYGKAPHGVSAIIIAGSQASLYGLFRILFTLFGLTANNITLGWFLIILGIFSMFFGVIMAFIQSDIKRMLGYIAVSQTGYMLLGVGVGLATLGTKAFGEYGLQAIAGGLFHVLNDMVYLGLLFLAAGAVAHRIGTTDMNKMGGLGHTMRYTSIFFLIGAMALIGIPPTNGFASKFIIYETTYQFNPILSIIAMIVSAITIAPILKAFNSAFLGPKKFDVNDAPASMMSGMWILVILIIIFGILPNIAITYLVNPASYSLANQAGYIYRVLGGVAP